MLTKSDNFNQLKFCENVPDVWTYYVPVLNLFHYTDFSVTVQSLLKVKACDEWRGPLAGTYS